MSGFLTAAATLERILSVAGPFIVALVGADNEKMALKVLDATATAITYARLAVGGVNDYAAELTDIADDLEAIQARGGVVEGDFDEMAERLGEKTNRLKAIVAARQA